MLLAPLALLGLICALHAGTSFKSDCTNILVTIPYYIQLVSYSQARFGIYIDPGVAEPARLITIETVPLFWYIYSIERIFSTEPQ
jgi:hypothetical protein